MVKEYKIQSALLRVLFSLLVCLFLVVFKIILKEEKIIEEIYNYLSTDIVFLR